MTPVVFLVVLVCTPFIPTALCIGATISPLYRRGNHTGNNGRLEATWLLPTLLLHHALATNAPVSIYAVDFQLAPTHVFHRPFWDVCSVLTSRTPLHLVSSVGVASDTFSQSR